MELQTALIQFKVELVFIIIGLILFFKGKKAIRPSHCTALEIVLFLGAMAHLFLLNLHHTIIIPQHFYDTPLQIFARSWLFLYAFGVFRHQYAPETNKDAGLFFLCISIFSIYFSTLETRYFSISIYSALLFPLLVLSRKKTSKKRYKDSLAGPILLGLILLPLGFIPSSPKTSSAVFLHLIPIFISLFFCANFIGVHHRAVRSHREHWYIPFHGFFLFYIHTAFAIFIILNPGEILLMDSLHILRFSLIWLILVLGFQNMVPPIPAQNRLAFIIPTLGILIGLIKIPVSGLFCLLILLCLPTTVLWFAAFHTRKLKLNEIPIMSMQLLTIAAAFIYLKDNIPFGSESLYETLTVFGILLILNLFSWYRHRKQLKTEVRSMLRTPILLLWILSLFSFPFLNPVAKKLHTSIQSVYESNANQTEEINHVR